MELLPCLVYICVVFELSRTVSSVQYTTVTLSNGTHICADGVQISPSAIQVRSVLQCALQFVGGSTQYNFFSYNRKFRRCSAVSGNPFRNYTIDTNCRCFQVSACISLSPPSQTFLVPLIIAFEEVNLCRPIRSLSFQITSNRCCDPNDCVLTMIDWHYFGLSINQSINLLV